LGDHAACLQSPHQYADVRYLGHISAIDSVLAIPDQGSPGVLEVDLTFPPGAVSATVYGGGIGTGKRDMVDATIVGGVMTGLVNFGIPAFMFGLRAMQATFKGLYSMLKSTEVKIIAAAGVGLYVGIKSNDEGSMDWNALRDIGEILFLPACLKPHAFIEAEAMGKKIAEQIPLVGRIMIAISIATNIAQMVETVAEVAQSPWMIENTVSTTITSTVTLHPDPRNQSFPGGYADVPKGTPMRSYEIRMIYKAQNFFCIGQGTGSLAVTL
jgi:hypothetical protein